MKKEHENVIPTPAELRARYLVEDQPKPITIDWEEYRAERRFGSEHLLRKTLEREAKRRREERRRELEMKISEDFHSARNAIFDESKKLLTRPKKKWYPMENKWR